MDKFTSVTVKYLYFLIAELLQSKLRVVTYAIILKSLFSLFCSAIFSLFLSAVFLLAVIVAVFSLILSAVFLLFYLAITSLFLSAAFLFLLAALLALLVSCSSHVFSTFFIGSIVFLAVVSNFVFLAHGFQSLINI